MASDVLKQDNIWFNGTLLYTHAVLLLEIGNSLFEIIIDQNIWIAIYVF